MNLLPLNPSDEFLIELVAKGALLMTIAFAITFTFKRASAALRHAVWSLAFVGLLLLPFCAALFPAWEVAIPQFIPDPQAAHVASVGLAGDASSTASTESPIDVDHAASPALVAPISTDPELPAGTWANIALFVWIAGAIGLLIRLALVLGKLSLLRRLSEPVTHSRWVERAGELSRMMDIRRPVRLLQHEEIVVPMTYGVRRPVILLPLHANDWSDDEVRVTLMHELLHVKRFDHLFHVLALAARAVHWFNPLTWAAAKRLVIERERACDDGVLSMGVASTSYADHLLGIARDVLSGREASTAALAMARPSELRTRIVAILDPAQPRRSPSRLRMLGMAGCALLLVGSLAAMQPRQVEDIDRSAIASEPEKSIGITPNDESTADFAKDVTELALENEAVDEHRASAPITSVEAPADTTEMETQRRALHAISELPRDRSIPLLTEVAETHRNPELRAEAVFWLGQVGDESAADLLERFARQDASLEVQKKAIFALAELDDRRGIPRLLNLARTHSSDELRADAVFWLGQEGGAEIVDALETFARSDASREVQKKAIFALAEMEDQAGVSHLIDLARTHTDPEVRSDAIFWLGETGDPRAADVLMDIVNGN